MQPPARVKNFDWVAEGIALAGVGRQGVLKPLRRMVCEDLGLLEGSEFERKKF